LGPGLFFSLVIFFTRTVGLLVRVISSSQGCYLHTGQHKHRINAHRDMHALSGIRTQDPSVRESEDSSCLIYIRNESLKHWICGFHSGSYQQFYLVGCNLLPASCLFLVWLALRNDNVAFESLYHFMKLISLIQERNL
jgi:hypothetical protein